MGCLTSICNDKEKEDINSDDKDGDPTVVLLQHD